MRTHQAAFQSFAGTGNRVATSAANQASIDYVVEQAEAAGLEVTLDPFEPVACTFALKAANAAAAGAAAVIVYNNVPGVINGTLGGPVAHNAPVLGTSQAIGQEWAAQLASGPLTARVKVDRVNEMRTSYNVLAETPGGDPDNVIVVGAHLDSVPRGPRFNDNGSGSAGILAMAEALEGRDIVNKSASHGGTPRSSVCSGRKPMSSSSRPRRQLSWRGSSST
jgi:Zn-dependent M28 family amino/carboxypeptidase